MSPVAFRVSNRVQTVGAIALVLLAGLASSAPAGPEKAQLRGSSSARASSPSSFRGGSGGGNASSRGGSSSRGASWNGGGSGGGSRGGSGGSWNSRGNNSHGGSGGSWNNRGNDHHGNDHHDSHSRSSFNLGMSIGGGTYGSPYYGSSYYGGSYYGSSWSRYRASDCGSSFSLFVGSRPYCPPPVYCAPRVVCPPPIYVRPCPTYIVSAPIVTTYEPVYVTSAPEPIVINQPAPQVIIRQETPAPIIVSSRAPQTRLDEVQTTSVTSTGGATISTASTNSTPIMAASSGLGAHVGGVGAPAPALVNDSVPADLTISALRSGADTIVLSISGTNAAANYQTGLAIEEYQSSVPVIRLRNAPPPVATSGTIGGVPAPSSQTPFTLNASIKAPATAGTLNVRIADREYQVPIVDAPRIGT